MRNVIRIKRAYNESRSHQSIGVRRFLVSPAVLCNINVPLYVLFINRNLKDHRSIDLSIVNGGDASESRMLESVKDGVAALWSRGSR